METPMLDFVKQELEARKGRWPDIARAMEPTSWESYYSWMTKLACGAIPDPGVTKVQRLADFFRGIDRAATTQPEQEAA